MSVFLFYFQKNFQIHIYCLNSYNNENDWIIFRSLHDWVSFDPLLLLFSWVWRFRNDPIARASFSQLDYSLSPGISLLLPDVSTPILYFLDVHVFCQKLRLGRISRIQTVKSYQNLCVRSRNTRNFAFASHMEPRKLPPPVTSYWIFVISCETRSWNRGKPFRITRRVSTNYTEDASRILGDKYTKLIFQFFRPLLHDFWKKFLP